MSILLLYFGKICDTWVAIETQSHFPFLSLAL